MVKNKQKGTSVAHDHSSQQLDTQLCRRNSVQMLLSLNKQIICGLCLLQRGSSCDDPDTAGPSWLKAGLESCGPSCRLVRGQGPHIEDIDGFDLLTSDLLRRRVHILCVGQLMRHVLSLCSLKPGFRPKRLFQGHFTPTRCSD